ncbi:MAG: hypothetical protein Q7S47_00790 [bacterium]|nr:hypothetical protein [bacterium]
MLDNYVCPQCGAEYDAPGVCETCQVALQEPDEVDELEGFQTDEEEEEEDEDDDDKDVADGLTEEDFASEEGEEEVSESGEYATTDTYEDQDNY